MDESLNKIAGNPIPEKKEELGAGSARVKKMRGWLGVKSSSPSHGIGGDLGPLLDGEGHCGWNR